MENDIIEFDDNINQFNEKTFMCRFKGFIRSKINWFKCLIPNVTPEKFTFRFICFIIVVSLILSYLVTSMYIMPSLFPHKAVYIPELPGNRPVYDNNNVTIILPENTPIPVIVTLRPSHIIKTNSTPVPDIINSGYIIGGTDEPVIKPLTGDDYNHIVAQEKNILYTDGLALNIYNQTDLGLAHYHAGDKALIKINTFNNLNEPITNLKAYITVEMLDNGIKPIKNMLIGDINVNIPVHENYLSSYNINIPNYKGSYGITVDVKGNDKSGFGVYWEIDIL
jgi:hypothetical protein